MNAAFLELELQLQMAFILLEKSHLPISSEKGQKSPNPERDLWLLKSSK